MSGRKKKHRVETYPTSSHAGGISSPPSAGKQRGGGRVKAKPPSRRWGLLAVQASLAGLILGVLMVYLSLSSVATSEGRGGLGPSPSQASGANPAAVATPPQAGATVPTQPAGQGVDPRRLELRTKGDPQAPVVVTEWFDFL